MDFIQEIIKSKGTEMILPLVSKLGISESQAQTFLPLAITAITSKVMGEDQNQESSFSLAGLLGGALSGDNSSTISSVLGMINHDEIAKESGLDAEQAKTGLETLAPMLMDVMKDKGAESIMGSLAGSDNADMLKSAGKLLGGLFG